MPGNRLKTIRLRLLSGVAACLFVTAVYFFTSGKSSSVVFPGISGPTVSTAVAAAVPARWEQYGDSGPGTLAVLLTDPDSAWLGLAHGLKTIGVPFRITRDPGTALKHRVVVIYPTISGKVLDQESLKALAAFPRSGGTLVGFNVAGGGLGPVFGFEEAVSGRGRIELRFDTGNPVTAEFTDPREKTIPINSRQRSDIDMGTVSYSQPSLRPLATYDNGEAAILHRRIGQGHTYAFGIDLGFFLLKGYNNRQQDIARSYANNFEPTLDVLLRLLRNIYREGEPDAVTLGTVPAGRRLAAILTHDIDYTTSVRNAVVYAEHEKQESISATHFIQTKYIRDWNDDVFFKPELLDAVNGIAGMGMEIGSHSVSHSRVFNKFPLGTGNERYPAYQPFVRDAERTDNGSILGELRVSRFLLGQLIRNGEPVSFRPGHLQNPFALPQAMEATGFRFSSTVTANSALTHLPFRLTWGRDTSAQTGIYEFPITIEDELGPRLGDRLPEALALAGRIARYGGLFVVLIHPNILGHKLDFQKRLVAALRDKAWFGSIRQFGTWWAARDQITWQIEQDGSRRRVLIVAPQAIDDLPLLLPAHYQLLRTEPQVATSSPDGRTLIIKQFSGRLMLEFDKADR